MSKRGYTYQLRTSPDVPKTLADLAGVLGFIAVKGGASIGKPSLPQMCEALAAAYRANPDQVIAAFHSIGVVSEQQTE